MKAKTWKTVPNNHVYHIWRDSAGKEHAIPPTFYENSGTPVGDDTGYDMEYLRTEVLLDA